MRTARKLHRPTLLTGCLGILCGLSAGAWADSPASANPATGQIRAAVNRPAAKAGAAPPSAPRAVTTPAAKPAAASKPGTPAKPALGAAGAVAKPGPAPAAAAAKAEEPPSDLPSSSASPTPAAGKPASGSAATESGAAAASASGHPADPARPSEVSGSRADASTDKPEASANKADDAAAKAEPRPLIRAPLPRLLHRPIVSVGVGEAVSLIATWQDSAPPPVDLFLYYRRFGQTGFERVRFGLRDTSTLLAQIPESLLRPGTLEYYISSRPSDAGNEPEQLHFASPAWPHAVTVQIDDSERRLREMLAQHVGNRSQFRFQGLYVDRGQRTVISTDGLSQRSMRDYYYRLEGDFTYRILSAVYSIRIGGGVVRGESFTLANPLPVYVDNVGLTYGFAEVRFRFGRLVRMDVRATLGAGPQHFDGGGGGQILIGRDPGTHFAVGIDGVSSVGIRAWLRLAWDTVPKVPMSFTLETSNLPLGQDMGGLMYLTLGYRFNRYFSFDATIGYAHRDKEVGGPMLGLGPKLEF